MGIHLVSLAEEYALPRVRTSTARAALLVMAKTARDQDLAPYYNKGSEHLAKVLGRSPSTVGRAISELRGLGLIRPDPRNRSKKRRWVLVLPNE